MSTNSQNADITIRGGTINVPLPRVPNQKPRHQPDTPPTKKRTTVRPDHKIPATEYTVAKEQPKATEKAPEPEPEPEPEPDSEE